MDLTSIYTRMTALCTIWEAILNVWNFKFWNRTWYTFTYFKEKFWRSYCFNQNRALIFLGQCFKHSFVVVKKNFTLVWWFNVNIEGRLEMVSNEGVVINVYPSRDALEGLCRLGADLLLDYLQCSLDNQQQHIVSYVM